MHPFLFLPVRRTAARTGSAAAPAGAGPSDFGPALMACSITLTPMMSRTVYSTRKIPKLMARSVMVRPEAA